MSFFVDNIATNNDLTNKMDLVPYGPDYTLKFKFISGVFNPYETNGILYYNLSVNDAVAIIPMISQINSDLLQN